MMRTLIVFFIFFISHDLHAQLINAGWVYGGSGNQWAQQCYLDKVGNRYQVITYNSNFVIDSAGYPITIQKNPSSASNQSIAIVKFDTSGKYVYHLRLLSLVIQNISLGFNTDNNVFLSLMFSQRDSLDLYDARGILYKRVVPQYNRKVTDNGSHFSTVLSKFNSNGQFIWINTIARESLPNMSGGIYIGPSMTINYDDEVSFYFPVLRTASTTAPDTLNIINTWGQKTIATINTRDVIFKFSTTGSLLSVKEPLKNHFYFTHDVNVGSYYRSVCDGHNTYSIISTNISTPDTFKCLTPLPLKTGINYLLIKTNEYDSLVWAKSITRQVSIYGPYLQLDYDTIKQELALSVNYHPTYFDFLLNPLFTNSNVGTYICKLSPVGNIIWEEFYAVTGFSSITKNYISKQTVLIGTTDGNEIKLQKYMPANPFGQSIAFVAFLDSLNNIFAAQHIISNTTSMSYQIRTNSAGLGYPITDPKGRTYVSGWFADSISLPCKKQHATIETDQFGNTIYDGFVLMLEAQIPIYTQACKSIISPSTKYIWDSSGFYFDTIPNHLGCDSVLLYWVKILTTKSILDTGVCKSMRSYSGKYLWDSTGTYYDTIPNAANCDSFFKVHLTVLQTVRTIDTTVKSVFLSPSAKHIWDSSGIYKDTLTSSRACDSILIIRLSVLQNKSNLDTSVCRSLISPSGKYFYTSTGIFVDTIPNKAGGDSIITIKLKIMQTIANIDTSCCGIYLSPSGRYTFNISGNYFDTIPNSNNCDSIIEIRFTKALTSDTINVQSCTTFTSPSKKYTYTITGIYTDTIVNRAGCDSLIYIKLIIKPMVLSISKSNNISCDSPFAFLSVNGGNTYLWYPASGLSNTNISNPIANPDTQTVYHVSSTDTSGCTAQDSIEIWVNKDETINGLPNVFTPNGDGINDCLPLATIAQFKELEFAVFSRWGMTVFTTHSHETCWNGTLKSGQEVVGAFISIF